MSVELSTLSTRQFSWVEGVEPSQSKFLASSPKQLLQAQASRARAQAQLLPAADTDSICQWKNFELHCSCLSIQDSLDSGRVLQLVGFTVASSPAANSWQILGPGPREIFEARSKLRWLVSFTLNSHQSNNNNDS